MDKLKYQKGLTLIEVLVAMAILCSVVVPIGTILLNSNYNKTVLERYECSQILKKHILEAWTESWNSGKTIQVYSPKPYTIQISVLPEASGRRYVGTISSIRKQDIVKFTICRYNE